MPRSNVTGWILAGGEGRRMGGVNKGLQPYQGRPLAQWVVEALKPQTATLHINANRDAAAYAKLLGGDPATTRIWPDDPDVNAALGPIAGILTGLRRTPTSWLVTVPCDTPKLPAKLVALLHQQATAHQADIAVPVSHDAQGEAWHHWTCALIHTRSLPSLEAAVAQGERRVGHWIRSRPWIGVSFDDPAAFININTPETLHGRQA